MSLSIDVAQIEIDARAVMAGRYARENYDKSFMATRIPAITPRALLTLAYKAYDAFASLSGRAPAILENPRQVGIACGTTTCDVWVGVDKVNLGNMRGH